MKRTDGFIEYEDNIDYLFTYSEEEKQEIDIARSNSKLVFNFKYLTIPRELFDLGLNGNELLVYAFLNSWLGNNDRFYFTNKQLGDIFNLSDIAISNIINKLKDKGLIDLSYKLKVGGGQIRFINLKKVKVQLKETLSSNLKKLYGNNNILNNTQLLSKDNNFVVTSTTSDDVIVIDKEINDGTVVDKQINTDESNTKEVVNDKRNTRVEATEIYDFYCIQFNFKKGHKRATSIERIKDALKKYSVDDIKLFIQIYKEDKSTTIKNKEYQYIKTCENFFGYDKGSKVKFIENFEGRELLTKTKTVIKDILNDEDNVDWL